MFLILLTGRSAKSQRSQEWQAKNDWSPSQADIPWPWLLVASPFGGASSLQEGTHGKKYTWLHTGIPLCGGRHMACIGRCHDLPILQKGLDSQELVALVAMAWWLVACMGVGYARAPPSAKGLNPFPSCPNLPKRLEGHQADQVEPRVDLVSNLAVPWAMPQSAQSAGSRQARENHRRLWSSQESGEGVATEPDSCQGAAPSDPNHQTYRSFAHGQGPSPASRLLCLWQS